VTTFAALFVPSAMRETVSDRSWVAAMLAAEAALAAAEEKAGVVPSGTAASIGAACEVARFDVPALIEQGRAVGNPVEPLVRALREQVDGEPARFVHWGATSQDVLDTAAMIVAREALGLIRRDLDGVANACAELATAHRSTPMAARTLLQQAVPTTFGLKAAGWLVGVLDARAALEQARDGLAVELGGAGGTLAALGERGLDVLRLYAEELELQEPILPWHTSRFRVAALGAALDGVAGAIGKIALDVVLLAQTEVGEVREPAGGGSSTMPQKRNPVGSVLAIACARGVHGHAGVLSGALAQEHERAAGAWHTEWEALSSTLALTGGAAAALREVLDGLEVDAGRMRQNLVLTGGLLMAERISFVLSERLGRSEAHALLARLSAAAEQTGSSFRDLLSADEQASLSADDVDELLDPVTYLGAAEPLVDRALARYAAEGAVA
jgi:3-carboxy-cis,cis-muconate cycloisomerase